MKQGIISVVSNNGITHKAVKILERTDKIIRISQTFLDSPARMFILLAAKKGRSEGYDHDIVEGRVMGDHLYIEKTERKRYGTEDYYHSIQMQIPQAIEYLEDYNQRLYYETIGNAKEGVIATAVGENVLSEKYRVNLVGDILELNINPYSPILHALQFTKRFMLILEVEKPGIKTIELIGDAKLVSPQRLQFTPYLMQYGKKTELETYKVRVESRLQVVKQWIIEKTSFNLAKVRAALILESLIPYSIGTFVSSQTNWKIYFLGLIALIFIQIAGNLLNDYFDYLTSKDLHFYQPALKSTGIHGSSRFIQHGLILPQSALLLGSIFLVTGGLIGLYVNYQIEGNFVLTIGVIGALLAILYSLPPISLGRRGLGELIILSTWIYLPYIGGLYMQQNRFAVSFLPTIYVTIIGLMTLLLIIQVELDEYEADRRVGKLTLLQVIGKDRFHFALIIISFLMLFLWIIIAVIAVSIPVAFTIFPILYTSYIILRDNYSQKKIYVSMIIFGLLGIILVLGGFM